MATKRRRCSVCGLPGHTKRSHRRNPVRRNLDAFTDQHGIHPIRGSEGYNSAKTKDRDVQIRIGKPATYAGRKEIRIKRGTFGKPGYREVHIEQHTKGGKEWNVYIPGFTGMGASTRDYIAHRLPLRDAKKAAIAYLNRPRRNVDFFTDEHRGRSVVHPVRGSA